VVCLGWHKGFLTKFTTPGPLSAAAVAAGTDMDLSYVLSRSFSDSFKVVVPVVVVVVVAAAASALVTCRHVMTSAKGPAVGTPNTAHKWHLLMGSLTCYRLLPTLVNIDVQCQNHLLCLLRLRMQLPLLLRRQPNCGRHYPPSPCHS